ncbi:LytR family transcriptional regulator [Xylanimonas oleitrophica]|uniref:LytR family transcriptional regulator n=1 Tax=Xylanimonas oleitrophica TaxID=2607479 RepID=A0A2W5WV34_9MICO|nr:LytR C-terminal domain-containing protein [Xylanimonas oleitrophica]PZR52126.1 LytR family transcriptional regulator [Xylanimonas oleitrophica]
MTSPVQDPARIARRRREHERQAVVFGVLIVLLVMTGLGALAVYTGAIEAPFARDFTSAQEKQAPVTPPCLPAVEGQPDGALPLPYDQVHVRIFNASQFNGVAGANQTVLSRRGFAVEGTANYSVTIPENELRFGTQGIVAAYTLAAHYPPMRMVLDTREDASVDLLVGDHYVRPYDEQDVEVSAETPLTNAPGCEPADEIEPSPVPTPAEESQPEDEEPQEAPAEG